MTTTDRNEMSPLQKLAFDLAVSYAAYCEAMAIPHDRRTRTDHGAINVWANMLRNKQEFFGIELRSRTALQAEVDEARRAMKAIDDLFPPTPKDAPY